MKNLFKTLILACLALTVSTATYAESTLPSDEEVIKSALANLQEGKRVLVKATKASETDGVFIYDIIATNEEATKLYKGKISLKVVTSTDWEEVLDEKGQPTGTAKKVTRESKSALKYTLDEVNNCVIGSVVESTSQSGKTKLVVSLGSDGITVIDIKLGAGWLITDSIDATNKTIKMGDVVKKITFSTDFTSYTTTVAN